MAHRLLSTTTLTLLAAAGGFLLGATYHTAAAARWKNIALTDRLTGLPNRRAAYDVLMPNHPAACIAIVDLDHLKQVNTDHGLHAGDRMIVAAATRMQVFAQATGNHVARLGGDEFLVVLTDTRRIEPDALNQIQDLLGWLSSPVYITDSATRHLSATAGVSDRAGSDEQTRACAGLALRTAKAVRGSALAYNPNRDGTPETDGARPIMRSRELPAPSGTALRRI